MDTNVHIHVHVHTYTRTQDHAEAAAWCVIVAERELRKTESGYVTAALGKKRLCVAAKAGSTQPPDARLTHTVAC